jgi:hypothetical protein
VTRVDDATLAFRSEVEDAIERDDPIELMDVVLQVANDSSEREWAQSCCVQLARHRSEHVRGNAVAGLGHLARRFGQLDPQAARRRVEIALYDRSDYVRDKARTAADDLRTFLSWEFEIPADPS